MKERVISVDNIVTIMSNLISRLKNISTSVKNFFKDRFTKNRKHIKQTEVTVETEVTDDTRNYAEDAEPTGVLLSVPHKSLTSNVLYDDDGSLKGAPYRNQEDVRLIKVRDITEAYLMFCRFGDQETITSKNHGGYELCAIDNSKEGLHFEMLVKPRKYPANTIATMSVINKNAYDVPMRTLYFVITNKS